MSKQTLIIAAIASRVYVKAAAESGFNVISIDCFTDSDTQHWANEVYKVSQENGVLNKAQLLEIIRFLNVDSIIGFCYGAGFEKVPDVLNEIGHYIPVLGNTAEVVKQTKNPSYFFKLCDVLGVPYPKVCLTKPLITDGHLQKNIGGTGGTHIVHANNGAANINAYYQKLQNGKSISCLFFANEEEIAVIGFNEQWLNPSINMPFRYGGAVSHVNISDDTKERFTQYVTQLSQSLRLVGLNSCDAICHGEDVVILEINPRLSASVDLYSPKQGMLAMHVTACQGRLQKGCQYIEASGCNAHQIIYAKCDTLVDATNHWPAWVSDVPNVGEYFTIGMPICTVQAKAETPALAKALVQMRAMEFQGKFLI